MFDDPTITNNNHQNDSINNGSLNFDSNYIHDDYSLGNNSYHDTFNIEQRQEVIEICKSIQTSQNNNYIEQMDSIKNNIINHLNNIRNEHNQNNDSNHRAFKKIKLALTNIEKNIDYKVSLAIKKLDINDKDRIQSM